ncbi:MAG: cytochrome C oxidase subunit IV family protein [Myxococcota bacterium]
MADANTAHNHGADHGHAHGHEHHISPLSTYMAVYGALLVLTVVTVGVSYLGLPSAPSLMVAMAVALVKASLVAAWFMHLKYDSRFNLFIFLATFWFGGSFFLFTFTDLSSRGAIVKDNDSFEYRQDVADGQ